MFMPFREKKIYPGLSLVTSAAYKHELEHIVASHVQGTFIMVTL